MARTYRPLAPHCEKRTIKRNRCAGTQGPHRLIAFTRADTLDLYLQHRTTTWVTPLPAPSCPRDLSSAATRRRSRSIHRIRGLRHDDRQRSNRSHRYGVKAELQAAENSAMDVAVDLPSTRRCPRDGGELPGAVHGREGLRLQGLVVPPRDSSSCVRAATSLITTAREASRFMARSSPTRTSNSATTAPASSRWPTRAGRAARSFPVHGADVVAGWEARGVWPGRRGYGVVKAIEG